jgi:hypothetical protein
LACASQQLTTLAGMSENSNGKTGIFGAGSGACVGAKVIPGGRVTFVLTVLTVLLGVTS